MAEATPAAQAAQTPRAAQTASEATSTTPAAPRTASCGGRARYSNRSLRGAGASLFSFSLPTSFYSRGYNHRVSIGTGARAECGVRGASPALSAPRLPAAGTWGLDCDHRVVSETLLVFSLPPTPISFLEVRERANLGKKRRCISGTATARLGLVTLRKLSLPSKKCPRMNFPDIGGAKRSLT